MSDDDQKLDQQDQREADQDDEQQDDQPRNEKSERDITLSRLSEERREARDRARKAEARVAELEAKQREADEAKAKEQGNYKELLEQREAELKEVQTSSESLQSRLDEALKVIADDIAATWKDVPEEVRDLYEGDDDDALAKKRHLTRSAKLIARLTERAEPGPRNGPNPKPTDRKTTTEQDNRARAAMRPRM